MEKTKYDGNQVIAWDKCDWMPKELQAPVRKGTLKLSEAIRIGARMRPQGRSGAWAQYHEGTSCALMAAHEAITGEYTGETNYWGTAEQLAPHTIIEKVWRLNDTERWSRERIANWLESEGY